MAIEEINPNVGYACSDWRDSNGAQKCPSGLRNQHADKSIETF